MAHVVIGQVIELSFASPHEMVETLHGHLAGEGFLVATASAIPFGEQRDIAIQVPLLGRQLRLRAEVLDSARIGDSPALRLRLHDGAHDTVARLGEIVARLRSGTILEETVEEGVSTEQRIRTMSPSLRAMLAVKANAEERIVLGRDPDPRVIEYLLKNPSLTIEEVRRLASRLSLHHGHFAVITRNSAWMGDEMLRTILARNPRLPEFMAENVLQLLPVPKLKELVKSMNTRETTRRVARKILLSRGITMGQGQK